MYLKKPTATLYGISNVAQETMVSFRPQREFLGMLGEISFANCRSVTFFSRNKQDFMEQYWVWDKRYCWREIRCWQSNGVQTLCCCCCCSSAYSLRRTRWRQRCSRLLARHFSIFRYSVQTRLVMIVSFLDGFSIGMTAFMFCLQKQWLSVLRFSEGKSRHPMLYHLWPFSVISFA